MDTRLGLYILDHTHSSCIKLVCGHSHCIVWEGQNDLINQARNALADYVELSEEACFSN